MNELEKSLLFGVFRDEEQMMSATKEFKDRNIPVYDVYTPFPVHGLDDLMGIKRSRLPIVCFVAGGVGLIIAIYFQIWTSAHSWPLNVGGKPFNSFVAFIPVAFEITVLMGALTTVAAFFFACKYYPGKKSDQPHSRVTSDSFVIAIECGSAAINTDLVRSVFRKYGVKEISKRGVVQ